MSIRVYVIDTSYLIELCGCGRDSIPAVGKKLKEFMAEVARSGGRFFVPLPCIFELGDHISDVSHDEQRAALISWLVDSVTESLEHSRPWTITPTGKSHEVLPVLMTRFSDFGNKMKLGLVDTFTIEEANRLKVRFLDYKARVHIWTNDVSLKKMEPDREPNSVLWKSDGTIFSVR